MTARRMSLIVILSLSSSLAAQQPVAIAQQLQQDLVLGYGTAIASVTVRQRQLRIQTTHPKVTENIFTSMLPIVCVHLGTNAKLFTEIAVVSKLSSQGYVYEQPTKCPAIAKTPLGRQLGLAILKDAHPL
jgi:hypothetical protein